jgi:hypothetical protein
MQMTFPRAVVDELRKEQAKHRARNKVLERALIMSELARQGHDPQISAEIANTLKVDNLGKVVRN